MTPQFKIHIQLIVFSLVAGGFVGFLFGQVLLGLVVVLLGWVIWNLINQVRLHNWLHRGLDKEVPEARGPWGAILDELHYLDRDHRASEAQLKSIIDRVQESTTALQDAVVMVDSHGNIEWWNKAAKRLLGLKRPDDVGQGVTNLIREPRFIKYFESRDFQEPLQLVSPIDQRIQLQYTITEFGQNERLMLIRDVTRVHRLERMRQDFVGNASHELRTPLTVIQGYLETLHDQYQDADPTLARALQLMESQAKRMANLVTDMLMLSRLETTDTPMAELPVDISHLMKEIYDAAIHLQPEKNHKISLSVEPGFKLVGQEQELQSAFSNLVFNAVKYTPENGEIQIKWAVDSQGGNFSVTDNGIGIDGFHINRLTERFYRVDQGRSSSQGGTGLGLAIVKHVLLRHNAYLDVESEPGQGSTFSCHFPSAQLRKISNESASTD